ncbi:MAG: DUF2938 domain-containing protein [Gemmatimonadaceae bacterium]|nr:DUF2938 domain-containing protein [Gemmatimonadaceae bacterium]
MIVVGSALELVWRAVVIGVGATVVMDLWAACLRLFGVPSLNLSHLGRWLAHAVRGRWRHRNIAEATPVPGESWLGWCAHYTVGVGFAASLLVIEGDAWAEAPSLLPALVFGWVTVLAPLFVLQPGMGAGIASRRTSRPLFNSVKIIVTHTVFGIGLYGAALARAWLLG